MRLFNIMRDIENPEYLKLSCAANMPKSYLRERDSEEISESADKESAFPEDNL
jgi:hypothetical protein